MALIRVRRKRGADPQSGLLVTGAFQQQEQEDDETVAGPSKRARQQEPNAQPNQPSAFRLIGTLPMPDVRDAARLFLPNENSQVVRYVEVDNLASGSHAPIVSVQMDNVEDLLMKNMAKVGNMDISDNKPIDPFLAVADEAPLARPESGLDGEIDDYVYDFYHAGTSFASQSFDRVHVRLPTVEEMQLYFGKNSEESEEDTNDGDSDSNAENYYGNEYPDEDDFEGALENDTTSDDSYDHYGDEPNEYKAYLSEADDI